MKFGVVDVIPAKKKSKHSLRDFLDSFVSSEIQFAKVYFSDVDYKSPRICYSCLRVAAKKGSYNVKVYLRGDDVFLEKLVYADNKEKEGDESVCNCSTHIHA